MTVKNSFYKPKFVHDILNQATYSLTTLLVAGLNKENSRYIYVMIRRRTIIVLLCFNKLLMINLDFLFSIIRLTK